MEFNFCIRRKSKHPHRHHESFLFKMYNNLFSITVLRVTPLISDLSLGLEGVDNNSDNHHWPYDMQNLQHDEHDVEYEHHEGPVLGCDQKGALQNGRVDEQGVEEESWPGPDDYKHAKHYVQQQFRHLARNVSQHFAQFEEDVGGVVDDEHQGANTSQVKGPGHDKQQQGDHVVDEVDL